MKRALVLALFLGVLPVAGATPCFAVGEGKNSARVIVESASSKKTFCVSFDDDSITGFEALEITGLDLSFKDFGAGQVTVCSIDGVGCQYPDEPCFCEYAGTSTFWGYFQSDGSGFELSPLGASVTTVRDRSVEAWVYAQHEISSPTLPVSAADSPCQKTKLAASGIPESTPARSAVALVLGALSLGGLIWLGSRTRARDAARHSQPADEGAE